MRPWEKGKFRQKVYLEDPKNKDASLEFVAANDSDSQFEAKEHAAMVALLKVQGSLPLERKLPDPYAGLWKASVAAAAASAPSKFEPKARAKAAAAKASAGATAETAKPAGAAASSGTAAASRSAGGGGGAPAAKAAPAPVASSGEAAADAADGDAGGAKTVAPLRAMGYFSSKAERSAVERQRDEERRRERNKREAARENRRRANANAPILLSKRMRSQLHAALGLDEAYSAAADDVDLDMEMEEFESLAVTRCVDWGFTPSDAMRALSATREEGPGASSDAAALAEQLRKWLCLHLPEDELPEEFAAGRGQFEIHKAGASKGPSAKAPTKSPFDSALDSLFAWIQGELSQRLSASDAEALFMSVELVLRGIEFDTADEAELQEAAENAVAVLEAEGEATEALCAELPDRWQAALELRQAQGSAEAAAGSAEPGKKGADDEEAEDDGDDLESTVASTADGGDADGFWEETCGRGNGASRTGTSAASQPPRRQHRGPWFGYGDPRTVESAFATFTSSSAGQRMRKHRETLPAAKSRDELLKLTAKSQVLLIQGETGCGKTTQVGQFLVEADPSARIVVTQPRRVAAVSVASRVAEERGEKLGTGAVGYSVRGETQLRRDSCRLLFCTNGILLRRLLGDPDYMFSDETCTHLVIDEVHERSVEIDLLLTLLSHKLAQRPKLRVLLMSATMDVEQLSSMFPVKPPSVKIPGRTFPVTQLYLEDAEDALGMYYAPKDGGGWEDDEPAGATRGAAQKSTQQRFLAPLDFSMLGRLVNLAARGELKDCPKEGAILVFVPGVGEIMRLTGELQRGSEGGGCRLVPLPLHGGLPPEQQKRCFEVFAKGGPRKVVISTNVAETSVTVPDVTIVIDTARERRLCLDPGAVAPCLAERHCAQSSLRQRKGRAGRVQAGLCLTMLPRREALALPKEAPPEIEAAALETLCLQVRVAGFDPPAFLARAPTPPAADRVAAAEKMQLKIGATRSCAGKGASVEVAALGRHLAALPCDVHTGKLLVLGAFMGVAASAADVAAMLSVRSPLRSVQRDPQADNARTALRATLRPGGGKSDHCLAAALLQLWSRERGARSRRDLCTKYALQYERMAEASTVRSQLIAGLRGLGFDVGGEDSRLGSDWRALRAATCAAFYPQIAKVDRPPKEYTEGIAGAVEKQAEARKLRYFVLTDAASDTIVEYQPQGWRSREDSMRAFLHPSSLLFKEASYTCPYVVFSSKQAQEARDDKPSRLNLSEASEASVFALLLFGGRLRLDTQQNEVSVDSWITFSGGSTTVVALVEKLRAEIDGLLLRKVENPRLSLGMAPVARAVATLISTDGLG